MVAFLVVSYHCSPVGLTLSYCTTVKESYIGLAIIDDTIFQGQALVSKDRTFQRLRCVETVYRFDYVRYLKGLYTCGNCRRQVLSLGVKRMHGKKQIIWAQLVTKTIKKKHHCCTSVCALSCLLIKVHT